MKQDKEQCGEFILNMGEINKFYEMLKEHKIDYDLHKENKVIFITNFGEMGLMEIDDEFDKIKHKQGWILASYLSDTKGWDE